MADTTGIQTVQGRIQNLTQLLAAAKAAAQPNQASIDNLQARLAKQQQELAMRQAKNAEVAGARNLANAQFGMLQAQAGQQIGQAQVGQEGDLLQSQRDLEALQRQQIGDYGGRDMLRSGVYQQAMALGEEDAALQRAQIIREYSTEIQGLQAQVAAGADARVAQIAAERARITAAYRLARLQNLAGG